MLKMRRKFKEWVVDGGVDGGDGGVERMVDGGSLTSWVKTGHGVHYRDLARETKECYQDQDQGSLPSKTPLLILGSFHFLCLRCKEMQNIACRGWKQKPSRCSVALLLSQHCQTPIFFADFAQFQTKKSNMETLGWRFPKRSVTL